MVITNLVGACFYVYDLSQFPLERIADEYVISLLNWKYLFVVIATIALGAAAAAFVGYLRNIGWPHGGVATPPTMLQTFFVATAI